MDDEEPFVGNAYRDGKVHVMRRMCDTCIFRPGNLMQLAPGRVEDMCREADEDHGAITCHSTLDGTENAVCKGYYNRRSSMTLRLAVLVGVIQWVTPSMERK